jgi:hypothetical protein
MLYGVQNGPMDPAAALSDEETELRRERLRLGLPASEAFEREPFVVEADSEQAAALAYLKRFGADVGQRLYVQPLPLIAIGVTVDTPAAETVDTPAPEQPPALPVVDAQQA